MLVEPAGTPAEPGRTVIYARVSSADQRADLDRQVAGLARFGVEHLQAALAAQDRQALILGQGEVGDDLVREMTEVLTSFCARLCGRRGARSRALRALGRAQTETPGA